MNTDANTDDNPSAASPADRPAAEDTANASPEAPESVKKADTANGEGDPDA
jgi:hypothetical protein